MLEYLLGLRHVPPLAAKFGQGAEILCRPIRGAPETNVQHKAAQLDKRLVARDMVPN